MKPITVTAGPVNASASPTSISAAQTAINQVALNGSRATSLASFQGTIAAATGILTVTAVTSGIIQPGPLSGANLQPNSVIAGLAPGSPVPNGVGSQWRVYPTQNSGSTAMQIGASVPLVLPAQVIVTLSAGVARNVTIYGTDAAGSPIQETISVSAAGSPVTTSQVFSTVTQVVSAVNSNQISVGDAPTIASPWVNFDPWADAPISYMTRITGTPNYTIQVTNDDPNDPETPVPPGQMVWASDPNANMVGATTPQAASWQFIPLYARILMNAGPGTVTATFVQASVINQ